MVRDQIIKNRKY